MDGLLKKMDLQVCNMIDGTKELSDEKEMM